MFDPQGVLYAEPERLLRDVVQAASLLSLVGGGVARVSELAARLGKPATSLSRLLGLGLVAKKLPYGEEQRGGKRSLYRVGDPFLAFWYRFVAPSRSRLEAGDAVAAVEQARAGFSHHLGAV